MDIQLKRGYIEICVLAATIHYDTYGYQLIKDVSKFIDISESTLYPILKRLENSGYVRSWTKEYNGRLRKYYRITEDGKIKISEFLDEFESILEVYNFIRKEYEDEEK